jgi:hypothetical protein
MKAGRAKRGQFVIIAVLMSAIMIVSIGAVMHNAITYYKHEPWEEYTTLIGNIELNSQRLLELSLADYTNSDQNRLDYNLKSWQDDLQIIYPGSGIILTYDSASVSKRDWNTRGASSQATADFALKIMSIGLTGYEFSATAGVKLTIIGDSLKSLSSTTYEISVAVKNEDNTPITNLNKNSFRIDASTPISVSTTLDQTHIVIYQIHYEGTQNPTVEVWDNRGIYVKGAY